MLLASAVALSAPWRQFSAWLAGLAGIPVQEVSGWAGPS
jgi:hypothetical protein